MVFLLYDQVTKILVDINNLKTAGIILQFLVFNSFTANFELRSNDKYCISRLNAANERRRSI